MIGEEVSWNFSELLNWKKSKNRIVQKNYSVLITAFTIDLKSQSAFINHTEFRK